MQISIKDVPETDRCAVAPCGAVCLGCDIHIGESFEAVQKLLTIWKGFNMDDVGSIIGLGNPEVRQVYEILDKFIKYREENGSCRGCYYDDGPSSTCSIAQCAKLKGFWTCAECDDFCQAGDLICPHEDIEKEHIPMASRSSSFELVSKRWCSTNIENLNRCRDIGYISFINEMKEKVNNGWRTWQVISPKKVFLEAFLKRYESENTGVENDTGK